MQETEPEVVAQKKLHVCSFCGEDEHNVITLVAGPGVLICNFCVELCVEAIAWHAKQRELEKLKKA